MYIYRKQKSFNDDDEREGMSTGGKVVLGTIGTIGTAAAAFAGAKKGVFGSGARSWAGKNWARLGRRFDSQSMMRSGLNDAAKGELGISAYTGKAEAMDKMSQRVTYQTKNMDGTLKTIEGGAFGKAMGKVRKDTDIGFRMNADKTGTQLGYVEGGGWHQDFNGATYEKGKGWITAKQAAEEAAATADKQKKFGDWFKGSEGQTWKNSQAGKNYDAALRKKIEDTYTQHGMKLTDDQLQKHVDSHYARQTAIFNDKTVFKAGSVPNVEYKMGNDVYTPAKGMKSQGYKQYMNDNSGAKFYKSGNGKSVVENNGKFYEWKNNLQGQELQGFTKSTPDLSQYNFSSYSHYKYRFL